MGIVVAREAPDSPDATELVTELESHLAQRYPAESRHGYSVARLLEEQVAFFVARVDGAAAACGGIQLVGAEYGEVKRMWVRPQFRRLGLGRAVLERLAEHALSHGLDVLRLETGVDQTAAIALYEGFGFRRIRPFPPYRDDPLSLCFEALLR
jgi:ribosomal protein S18 acetylase RimI-like enzyme